MQKLIVLALTLFISFTVLKAFIHPFVLIAKSTTNLMAEPNLPITANGKRFEAVPKSSMLEACGKLGLNVLTDCKKGNCGTCTITLGGNKMRACIGVVSGWL